MVAGSSEFAGTNRPDSNEIVGGYILQERLGGGDFSSTFKAIEQTTGQIVAIKIFPKALPAAQDLYEAEIKAYTALNGLPGILEHKLDGEDDAFRFIVTEFIEEGSLRNILNNCPEGMNIQEVIDLFSPIAETIDHMHGKSIIHRDLKPENILIRKLNTSYQVFITDFGIVRFTSDSNQFHTEHTAGTAWYIAPEAWNADPDTPQTKAVDIYSLGVMLYEALEGKMPFSHPTGVIDGDPYLPERTRRESNADVVKYLLKPLKKDPEQRPRSAREAIKVIRNAYRGNLTTEQRWEGREFGNYVVEKVLGTGKMGIALRAREKQTNRLVVLKAFEYSPFGNPIQAFENEIKSLERLENGHGVLTPQDSFEQDGIFFIVSDYQSGGSLRQLMNRRPKLPVKEIIEIFTQVAEAIDYVHENKIIHRDIKPENIVFNTTDGRINPFLTDFGISIILESAKSSFQTQHGAGTYRYMAPELWRPKAKKTKAVDIYSFGIMLYEAFEGHAPFDAEYPAVINQHLSTEPPLPKNTLKELGVDAQNVLLQTLAKNAEERPKTATEIIQQIKGEYTKFLGKEFGKYTVDKFIGQGAYGSTYRAHDSLHKRKKFALKILSVPKANLREMSKLKELGRLPGVLPVLEANSEDDTRYIITEYLNGNNLRDMFQNYSQGMGLEETLKVFRPVAKALDSLHNAGIIHGDLKPENIVFHKYKEEHFPRPFVTDYGIFKVAGKTQVPNVKIDILAGNFAYMAPEIWEDQEPSPASDVYALGIMLYEALEGTLPFQATSFVGIMRQHLNEAPPSIKKISQPGGGKIWSALSKALDKKPENRQKSAAELISQLEDSTKTQTTTSVGPIRRPLIDGLEPILNAGKKKIEISLSRLVAFTAVSAVIVASLLYPWTQPSTDFSSTATPTVGAIQSPSPTIIATGTIASATATLPAARVVPSTVPTLPGCDQQYSTTDAECGYTASETVSLEKLYTQFYGNRLSGSDLYAIAYYNNRRALEERKYNVIDPKNLKIEKGWKVFLPSLESIQDYNEFPIPVLEAMNLDPANAEITLSGSSTLDPLSLKIKEGFETATQYHIDVKTNNTTLGLADFCQSKAQLFGVTEGNLKNCPNATFLKFEVARYAVVIFINDNNVNGNKLIENPLNAAELNRLLTTAETWRDVRSDFSDEPIKRYYPADDRGVFEIVRNEIFPTMEPGSILNLETTEESLIPDKVKQDDYSIGFSSYVNYQNNKDSLTAISVNRVSPNWETIMSEIPAYSLTRRLYLYTGEVTYQENALLRSFINYYLAYEFDYLTKLGYFPPSKRGVTDNPYTTP